MKTNNHVDIGEHVLATVESDRDGKCRYVCSCGTRGMFVGTITAVRVDGGPKKPPVVLEAEEWARGAHRWHVARAGVQQ